jgi:hypothetical protein
METITLTLRIEIGVLVIGLAVIVIVQALSGAINTKGLLADKGGGAGFSPARLQLLLSTFVVAFYYIGQLLTTAQTGVFPRVPNEMLLVLGGSHTFYLGSKTVSLILETLGLSNNKRPKS